jgi:TonB family protein
MRKITTCLLAASCCLAQTNPTPAEIIIKKGFDEMSRGDLTSAEADFTAALSEAQLKQDQAHEVSADYHLSMLSEMRHKPDEAEKWLLNGLESCRKPGSRVPAISILPYLHSFYARHGMWSEDATTLKSIVEVFSADPAAHLRSLATYSELRGEAFMKVGDFPSAEAAFRSQIAFEDQTNLAHGETAGEQEGLINALEKQGKEDEIRALKAARQPRDKLTRKPPELISKVSAIEPEYARRAKLKGLVILSANVAETGEIKDIAVVVPLGFSMERASIEAVRRWKFKPGTDNGKPESRTVRIEIQVGGR